MQISTKYAKVKDKEIKGMGELLTQFGDKHTYSWG